MLHELLLSLSGHPSPLLTADHSSPNSILSPPEKALLSSIAHLSDLHCKLIAHTNTITSTHPSSICQAVATAISSTHLGKFQRKVLEVEDGILRKDAGSVGAYNIVPLTAIVGEFSGWTRRMEWFLEVVDFMRGSEGKCSGAMVIDRLCDAIQTGYVDIEEAALSLVKVAEMAWLKQVSSWILYGRLPSFGREDFFVQTAEDNVEVCPATTLKRTELTHLGIPEQSRATSSFRLVTHSGISALHRTFSEPHPGQGHFKFYIPGTNPAVITSSTALYYEVSYR